MPRPKRPDVHLLVLLQFLSVVDDVNQRWQSSEAHQPHSAGRLARQPRHGDQAQAHHQGADRAAKFAAPQGGHRAARRRPQRLVCRTLRPQHQHPASPGEKFLLNWNLLIFIKI